MTITALQEAQHYADDLSLQLCLLADNAEAYSHAGTLERTYYGLCWIQSILQHDILHTLNMNIEECEYLMNAKRLKGIRQGRKAQKGAGMKKTYRLHYACVDGCKPADRTRNWLCLTMIEQNKDITTLALDEDALENIMHHCKDNTQCAHVMDSITARINRRIQEGHHEGSITVAL